MFCLKKNYKKIFLLQIFSFSIGFLFFINSPSLGQQYEQIKISGVITDSGGDQLIGVNIVEKGTSNGTISDYKGEFYLSVKPGATVVFSYLGFKDQSVTITKGGNINIVLVEDNKVLDEVVVVGYGTQKKANLTGAVSSVKFDDVASMPVANTMNMLQGRLPGVVLTGSGSQAGKDIPEIRIRGIGTLSDYNDPMVLIDGVESSVSQMADVPANDIENVSVLKDAASASIYGVRAANGVILITTKRGFEQKPQLTYSGSFTYQQATVLPSFVDSYNWALMYNEANGVKYNASRLQKILDGSDPDLFANTNWVDQLFRAAPMHQHHLSLSGGNKDTHYMFSLQYFDQDGILISTGSKKYNFRSNIDSRIGIFKVGLNLSGTRHDIEEPRVNTTGDDGVMRFLTWFTRPTVPVKYSNGHYAYNDGTNISASAFKNPIDEINRGYKDNQNYRLDFMTFGEVDILKGLKFRTSLAYKLYINKTSNFNPTYSIYDYEGYVLSQSKVNSMSDYLFMEKTYLNENILSYNLDRGANKLNVLLGHSIQALRADANSWSIQNFPNNELFVMSAGTENPGVSGNAYENSLLSLFGRVNYNYDDRYLAEVNLRRDGSSRMPANNRFATFPSFSVGWIASNEKFFADIKEISSLKVRASWGQLGNQEIGNYPFAQTMKIGANYYFGNDKSIGLYTQKIANDQIKWETTTIADIGIDIGLLKNRVSLTFDWFNKMTSDILLQLAVPYTFSGIGSVPYQNVGKVQNRGWELSVNYNDSQDDFRWTGGFNLSGIQNKIIDNYGVDAIIGSSINREGYAIRSFYGLNALGIYKTDEDVLNHTQNVNGEDKVITINGKMPQKGDIMYEDVNKDGNISSEDRVIIGNPFPKLQYAFNIGAGYKQFDLSLFFQGVAGIYRYNWEQTTLSNGGNMTTRWLDRWSEDNINGSMPRLGNVSNDSYSSFWLSKADYLRLKNIELGYTLTNIDLKKVGLSEFRVFLASANLWTLSYLKNYDPEKTSSDSRNDAHPTTKTFSIGVKVKFL